MMTGYEGMELSTQILVREALQRGITVEVLDMADNFIRLAEDGHSEYIKQATRTSADTYIAPLIMENKEVSVIELNFNPALHIHNFPYQGQNRHVERKVLDLLGF
jgi:D-alanine-D-alanine ligase-like ATP-grasp enzyme